MTDTSSLTTLVYLPLISGLILLATPENILSRLPGFKPSFHWFFGLAISFSVLAQALGFMTQFPAHIAGMQFATDAELLTAIGLNGSLGMDGISLWLIVLTALITPVMLIASANKMPKRTREFVALILVIEGGALGAFLTADLLLFFVFWQLVLIPTFYLIRLGEGDESRQASATFGFYTGLGSVLMLIGIVYLQNTAGSFTFSEVLKVELSADDQAWLAIAFSLGFLMQVPAFPFHGWLTSTTSRAPLAAGLILAVVIVQLGSYGLLRFALPLFPEAMASYSPILLGLAVLGIVYASLAAYGQSNLKKLIAYSSVSCMAFVLLGIVTLNEQAIQGALVLLISHGLAISLLVLVVDRLTSASSASDIEQLSGIATKAPLLASCLVISVLCLIGMPLTSGFVGEFLVLSAAFTEGLPIYPGLGLTDWPVMSVVGAGIAATGIIFAAMYGIRLIRMLLFGSTQDEDQSLTDFGKREFAIAVPIIALIFLIGMSPNAILKPTETAVASMVNSVRPQIQLKRDAKRLKIRAEKLRRSARPGPGQIRPGKQPSKRALSTGKVRRKGTR
jgi:NADH-quinone oxidoreductase subunit M